MPALLKLSGVIGAAAGLVLASAIGAAQTGSGAAQVPATATAIEGVPSVRLDATAEGVKRRTLSREEAARERLTIEIVNGQFYWSSRDKRPLKLFSTGPFTYLAGAEPGQYVRFTRLNDRLTYVEHVDTGAGIVTYWGELKIVLGK